MECFSQLMNKRNQFFSDIKKELDAISLDEFVTYIFQKHSNTFKEKWEKSINQLIENSTFPNFKKDPSIKASILFKLNKRTIENVIRSQKFWGRKNKNECLEAISIIFKRFEDLTLAKYEPTFHEKNLPIKKLINKKDTRTINNFLENLLKINSRDWLIAMIMRELKMRVSSVLQLRIKDFTESHLCIHSKKGIQTIPLSSSLCNDIREFIKEKRLNSLPSDYLFITRTEKAVSRRRINYSFIEASKRANTYIIPDEIRFY